MLWYPKPGHFKFAKYQFFTDTVNFGKGFSFSEGPESVFFPESESLFTCQSTPVEGTQIVVLSKFLKFGN